MVVKPRWANGGHGRPGMRRYLFLAMLAGAIMGAFVVTSSKLRQVCPVGSFCNGSRAYPTATHSPSMMNQQIVEIDSACAHFPDTSRVLLIMKTGASESHAKIPAQVVTTLRCLNDYLIFSDMEQTIGEQKIYNSLDTVLPEAQANNTDFDLYRRQQRCPVDQESCNKPHGDTAREGWMLDKYKNIHMAEKTYRMRPNYDWYLFVDADTYVLWETLTVWLEKLNPLKQRYLGSAAILDGFQFAHGGSGYLVSKGMMRGLFHGKFDVANKWDMEIKDYCCGDYMFARAVFNETKSYVVNVWPTINGERPNTLSFNRQQWCQPIATLHHIGVEELYQLHDFEQGRNTTGPLRVRDLYSALVQRNLATSRTDWDNQSEDVTYQKGLVDGELPDHRLSAYEQQAHSSFDSCRLACRDSVTCLQFRYRDGTCALGNDIRLGSPAAAVEGQSDHSWSSGWDLEKIDRWTRVFDDECKEFAWPAAER